MNPKIARIVINIKRFFFFIKNESIRYTQLGMHMLSASRTNSSMRETYEELGKRTFLAMKENRVHFDSEQEQQDNLILLKRIEGCLNELDRLDEEVKQTKIQKRSYR